MPEKEWEVENVFDIFGDSLSRKLLVLLSERRMGVEDLAADLEASRPTIYRRINAMCDFDLLDEQQEVDDRGHHYRTFETTLKRISLEIEDGGYDIDITLRRSMVDQFESFWTDLEDSSPSGEMLGVEDGDGTGPRDDLHHG